MPSISINKDQGVEITISAATVATFGFKAQFRVPGSDYVQFASGEDSAHVPTSSYSFQLKGPITAYTDLRIYLLIDGPANRPFDVVTTLAQAGRPMTPAVHTQGSIGSDGKASLQTVEATLV
jgi:hypothetical protein